MQSTDPAQLECRWTLHSVATSDAGLVDADPHVPTEMTFGDGGVFGRAGVNRYRGTYEALVDGTVAFGGIAATRMTGPEAAMAQEMRFFSALSAAASFEVIGDRLVLRGTDGATVAILVMRVQERVPD